jgi:hypothetical protein
VTTSPDHVCFDGARIPLAWTPTGATTARAALDACSLRGTLGVGYDTRELAVLAVAAVLGGGAAGGPGARYTLQVDRATVETIPVADGERRF